MLGLILHGVGRSRSVSAAAWTPAALSGLVGWWDAMTGITLAGSKVSGWADQSGNGSDLVQATGSAQPTYQSTGWNSSKPTLSFDGINTWMSTANATLTGLVNGTNSPFTVMAVVKAVSNTSFKILTGWDDGAGNGRYILGCDNAHKAFATDGTNSRSATATFDGSNIVVAYEVGGGTITSYLNGTLDFNGAVLGIAASGTTRFLLGLHPLGAFPWNGLVSEVVIYSAKYGATEAAQFRTYAQAKWTGL